MKVLRCKFKFKNGTRETLLSARCARLTRLKIKKLVKSGTCSRGELSKLDIAVSLFLVVLVVAPCYLFGRWKESLYH